jgi:radical SAM family uncharacterized protein/radical SAM-linked protein
MKNRVIENILETKILPFINKPGRYIGNEINIIRKDEKKIDVRVALAFPDVYELAMSFIGFKILYHILNQEDDIWAERVYAPWKDMQEKMRRENLPLYSLESFTPLKDFDVVGFTLQYELTYTNILSMLDLAGISILQADRDEEDPFIVGGGPSASNPEPMADFFDLFFIGDGEEGFVEICNVIKDGKKQGLKRRDILRNLSKIKSVYVPSFYKAQYDAAANFISLEKIEAIAPDEVLSRIVPNLKNDFYEQAPLVPLIEVTHDRLSLEVMRGCTEGCRFCNAGMIYRPTREREPQDIVQQSVIALNNSGYEEVSFLSLSISDYSRLPELMVEEKAALEGKNINVSFPSMRLDSFTEEIAAFASGVRKSGFTFAPEAGSERLRQVINKNISEEDLYKSVEIALRNGWKVIKFYFMIGLPTETMEDVDAIADLLENVVKTGKSYGGRVRFNVSVSPFSPKPHTPFQWERQNTQEEFNEKIELLRRRFSRMRSVKLNWRDPDVSLLECVLGRGDRRLSKVVANVWRAGGSFDGWSDYFDMSLWQEQMAAENLNFAMYSESITADTPLPWQHINKGVTRSFLLKEWKKAAKQETTKDCKKGYCFACGIQRKGFKEHANCYDVDLKNKNMTESTFEVPTESENRVKNEPEAALRFRIHYKKTGLSRYLSHLDLIRLFSRAARRANIRLMFTQGFNPHPKMSFGPSLSLGVTSVAEYLDMDIEPSFKGDPVSAFNPFLPLGLEMAAAKRITEKIQTINQIINLAEYEVDLSGQTVDQKIIDEILSRDEIPTQRRVKKRDKIVDIRPYIESIQIEKERLRVHTCTIENRTVRMAEILRLLFKDAVDTHHFHIHRKAQWVRNGDDIVTPMELVR